MREGDSQPEAYVRAARFNHERDAGRAYDRSQDLVFRAPCDLSAYRLQVSQVWHVAIVGETPPEDLNRRIERILSRGEPAALPDAVVEALLQRSAEARSRRPWTEGHYRPGRGLSDL